MKFAVTRLEYGSLGLAALSAGTGCTVYSFAMFGLDRPQNAAHDLSAENPIKNRRMNNESVTHEERLAKAIDGDSESFAKMFEDYRPRLRRMVDLRMDARARARFDPSDVLQEAFVEAARALPKYAEKREQMPFFLWLRLITGDRLAKFHRKHLGTQKRDATREAKLVPDVVGASSIYLASQLVGEFTSVDHNLKVQEAKQQLEDALEAMDEKDREIIAMRHYEELSTEEIAIVLNMTKSGVLKRYARAIEKLTTAIETSDR